MSANDRTSAMPHAGPPVAWDTPGTRGALSGWLAQHVAKPLGWAVAWVGIVYVTLLLPTWVVAITVPLLAVVMYCLVTGLFRLANYGRMYRILHTYPWQQQADGVRLSKGKQAVFVLPDPDRPDKTASPKEPGVLIKRWDRIARRGFDGELWYAGDPRFAVVVAKPGLKALGYARQPTAFDRRTSPRSRGVSPEARQRALAIGARVGPERDGSQS